MTMPLPGIPVTIVSGTLPISANSGTAFVVQDNTPTARFIVDTLTPAIQAVAPTTIQYTSATAFLVRSGAPATIFQVDTNTPQITMNAPVLVKKTSTTALQVQDGNATLFFYVDTVNFLCEMNTYLGIGTSPVSYAGLLIGNSFSGGNDSVYGLLVNAITGATFNSFGIYITKPTGTGPRGLFVEDVPIFAGIVATTAGGALGQLFGSAPALGIYFGSGAPTVSANKGSLYLRTDGASNVTRAYINTNGTTTWTAINTVG